MKELYLNAEMDIVKFAAEDVIATSSQPESSTPSWSIHPNETEPDYGAWDDMP